MIHHLGKQCEFQHRSMKTTKSKMPSYLFLRQLFLKPFPAHTPELMQSGQLKVEDMQHFPAMPSSYTLSAVSLHPIRGSGAMVTLHAQALRELRPLQLSVNPLAITGETARSCVYSAIMQVCTYIFYVSPYDKILHNV